MPINLNKAKGAIEKYRTAHELLHADPPERLSDAHDPLTDAMRDTLQKWGFNHEDDVFEYSDNEVVTDMGYTDVANFMATVYDNDGNVVSGKETDHITWEERWK